MVQRNAKKREPIDPREVADAVQGSRPQAVESEVVVLGSCLIEPEQIGECMQVLRGPEDFYKAAHRVVWQMLTRLYDQNAVRAGEEVDYAAMKRWLTDRGLIDEVGGIGYLIDLAEAVSSAAGAVHHAREVRTKAKLRDLADTCGRILYDAHQGTGDVNELVDAAEAEIMSIADTGESDGPVDLATMLQTLYNDLEHRMAGGESEKVLPTGFADLDEALDGGVRPEYVIVAARPSMGKTALCLNLAEQFAVKQKKPVAFFSLEMDRDGLGMRLVSAAADVPLSDIRRGKLDPDAFDRIRRTVQQIDDAPLYVDDRSTASILQLRASARRMHRRHGLAAIFIDYVQLMHAPKQDNRQMEVSTISRGIKTLQGELGVPIIVMSQLNRKLEERTDKRPTLSDLRESGSLEQDADTVMMLHREDYYRDPYESRDHACEVIIAKQRNGPRDTVTLHFVGETGRFGNRAREAVGLV